MKKTAIILSFFAITNGLAQGKPNCEKLFETFKTYYQTGFNEKSILTEEGRTETLNLVWKITKECPSYNKNAYTLAEEMLLRIIKPMNFGENRQQWTQHLVQIYDQYSQYFPETAKQNTLKKIVASYNNKVYTSDFEAYKTFDRFYTQNKAVFSVEALLIYANLFEKVKKTEQNVWDFFQKTDDLKQTIKTKISELEAKDEQKNHGDLASLKTALTNIERSKNVVISCEELNKNFENYFRENKTDIEGIEGFISNLEKYKCTSENPFFAELVETYYELQKTSKSAFYMGSLAQQRKENQKAIVYFNESADLETDPIQKAKMYYRIANFYIQNDKSKAKLFLEQTLENNPEMLEAVISLSRLYVDAERSCFNSDFEYQMRYFLASKTLENFAKTNPKYKSAIQKQIDDYHTKAPTKKEIRTEKMKGKTVKIGCWISQDVLVP